LSSQKNSLFSKSVKNYSFWDITPPTFLTNILPLSSGLNNKAKEEINIKQVASRAGLASSFLSGFLFGLFLTLKMKSTTSSEKSVIFPWNTLCYVPDEKTFHYRLFDDLKSYKTPLDYVKYSSRLYLCYVRIV
jgi:hypothetical protein